MLKIRCRQEVTIDAKGRLTLPAKIRAAIEKLASRPDFLVVGPDEECVLAWVPDHFEQAVEAPLAQGDAFDPRLKDWAYKHVSSYEDLDIDPAGRINLPKSMRDQAGLTKDCLVFVLMGRIEIWDRDRWQRRYEAALTKPDVAGMPVVRRGEP